MHPKFMLGGKYQTFPFGLNIRPVYVNPKTKSVDEDETKNTKLQIWLEHGPYEKIPDLNNEEQPSHDRKLDCGADTFEEAIIKLAELVKKHYGSYNL